MMALMAAGAAAAHYTTPLGLRTVRLRHRPELAAQAHSLRLALLAASPPAAGTSPPAPPSPLLTP